MKNKHIGSSFDDFLKEDGLLEGAEEMALERTASGMEKFDGIIQVARNGAKAAGMKKADIAGAVKRARKK
jgi:hypothetical protein